MSLDIRIDPKPTHLIVARLGGLTNPISMRVIFSVVVKGLFFFCYKGNFIKQKKTETREGKEKWFPGRPPKTKTHEKKGN